MLLWIVFFSIYFGTLVQFCFFLLDAFQDGWFCINESVCVCVCRAVGNDDVLIDDLVQEQKKKFLVPELLFMNSGILVWCHSHHSKFLGDRFFFSSMFNVHTCIKVQMFLFDLYIICLFDRYFVWFKWEKKLIDCCQID